MIKLFIGLFSVLAVANAGGYGYGGGDKYELASLEAPLLPKGGVVSYSYAQSQVQPLYQSPAPPQQQPPAQYQPAYASPPPPQQQQPLRPYYPQAPQQQQPAQSYVPPAQSPPAQSYVPVYPQPPPQQQQPAPEPYQQPAQQPPAQSYVPQPPPQQQPPTQSYVQAAQPPQSYAPAYPQPPPQQPPRPVENFCQKNNLVEGYHGRGCKPYYFACSPATTTRIVCPKGLFYDVQTQQCDYKTVIVACGGRPPAPPQQPPVQQQPYAPAPQQQQPSYSQPASLPPAFNPPTVPEYDCKDKADGIYVVGCSDKYYICMLGTATSLSCPTGTFYSAKTERCDYKAHVVECGGILPPPAQNPAPPTYGQAPQPSYPQQQQPQQPTYGQAPPQQQPSNNNQCANLENGIYGRKCSRHFVACSNYRTYEFMCPRGYAFNLKTVKCAPKNQIETCAEYEIPQAQPPAPPAYDSQPLVPDYVPPQQTPVAPAPYAPQQQQPSYQPPQQQYY